MHLDLSPLENVRDTKNFTISVLQTDVSTFKHNIKKKKKKKSLRNFFINVIEIAPITSREFVSIL